MFLEDTTYTMKIRKGEEGQSVLQFRLKSLPYGDTKFVFVASHIALTVVGWRS